MEEEWIGGGGTCALDGVKNVTDQRTDGQGVSRSRMVYLALQPNIYVAIELNSHIAIDFTVFH